MHRHRPTRAFALVAVLLATVFAVAAAPLARADHRRRFDGEDVALLAHRLDDSAFHAYRLSSRQEPRYRQVNAAFARLSEAADDFHRVVESGRYDAYRAERAFDLLADRYYELRGEFRNFHGSSRVRAAFHDINEPMERLYWTYTGRDLYRDDPNVRHGWGSGGVRDPHRGDRGGPRYDDRYDGRYDDRYDGGARGGAGHTRPGGGRRH